MAGTKRPAGITFVVILVFLSGLLNVVGGILTILNRNNHTVINAVNDAAQEAGTTTSDAPTLLLWAGIVMIVLGVIALYGARALSRGSGFWRVLLTILEVFAFVSAIISAVQSHGTARTSAIVSAVFSAFLIYLLNTLRAKQFTHTN